MREVRERLTIVKSVAWTEKQSEDVQKVADMLKTSFAEVVRVCVEIELPKMRERTRKRKSSGKS